MKVGIIGDIHYPFRSNLKGEEFIKWFEEERVEIIICTGDLNAPEILEYMKK